MIRSKTRVAKKDVDKYLAEIERIRDMASDLLISARNLETGIRSLSTRSSLSLVPGGGEPSVSNGDQVIPISLAQPAQCEE